MAVPALTVRVHLHVPRVDGGVDHSPGSPSELRLRWDVDQHRLPIFPQTIHNVGTELQHLVVHVWGKRTRHLKPQHVSAPAPPRVAKPGDTDSRSALLRTSCYRTASSGPEGLRRDVPTSVPQLPEPPLAARGWCFWSKPQHSSPISNPLPWTCIMIQ